MGHSICGFVVFESDLMKVPAEQRAVTRFKVLKNGFAFVDDRHRTLVRKFPRDAVWVRTDYHGGPGEQSARIVRHQLPAMSERFDERFDTAKEGNINAALREWNSGFPSMHEIQSQGYHDLFEYVGLDTIRDNDALTLGGKEPDALPPNVTLTKRHGYITASFEMRPDGDIPSRLELEPFDEVLAQHEGTHDVRVTLTLRGGDNLGKCFSIVERVFEVIEKHFNPDVFHFELDVHPCEPESAMKEKPQRLLVVQWQEADTDGDV